VTYRGHWLALGAVIVLSFAVLAGLRPRIGAMAPPVPARVATPDGRVLFDGDAILRGQNAWQAMGGQEVGTVWGHGAYVAPDWTADGLHREATTILDGWARQLGAADHGALTPERQAGLRERLVRMLRTNGYDPATGTLTVPAERAAAFDVNAAHLADVFGNGRDAYAIPRGALTGPAVRDVAAFFWWTSWASVARRPGSDASYTQNWPHDPLVGNRPTPGAVVWSVISFVLLLAGIGALTWYHGRRIEPEPPEAHPPRDPLFGLAPTPSQRATVKYFWVAAALLVVQIALGAVTAHYGVEGSALYGIPLAGVLPYAVTRTWHLQLGIFWIATTWLATGLYVGPAVSGAEPRGQRALVNVLFAALLLVVIGSLAGEWASVQHHLGTGAAWFWLGHMGYEYVDLGRLWQLLLFVGLFLWLFLMVRALWPALRRPAESRALLLLFVLSSAAIALFYGAALMVGRHTHLAIAEYWRWWVVHLWVEGFFEVFATVVIAFLFVRLGLLHVAKATRATFFSTTVFLAGGILGTFHHLYFAGTPEAVTALGAVFSALEVVPLALVGLEVWQNIRLSRARTWLSAYRWPIRFFVAVAFWNLVGAGLFGFFINPPIALYYMQGLNTTPVHGHTALFGVYGMLGIGLMLFCLRALRPGAAWRTAPIAASFWLLNVGLALMVLLSLLPVGILQTWASVEQGTWWARSAEFMQQPGMSTLRWLRVPGDTIFAIGAFVLGWFVLGLATGWSLERRGRVAEGSTVVEPGEPAEGRA
jgi:nitric oxide reductase subunit B